MNDVERHFQRQWGESLLIIEDLKSQLADVTGSVASTNDDVVNDFDMIHVEMPPESPPLPPPPPELFRAFIGWKVHIETCLVTRKMLASAYLKAKSHTRIGKFHLVCRTWGATR